MNPAIFIIQSKKVVSFLRCLKLVQLQLSADSMNATIIAMTNSAAESFIIMNSIFFGVSDIGISTIVQQSAFYSLIIQGIYLQGGNRFILGGFYLYAPPGTKIDQWIITRDTIFFIVYLAVISLFLYSNNIQVWQAAVLMFLYLA